jgi:hypothetical protein
VDHRDAVLAAAPAVADNAHPMKTAALDCRELDLPFDAAKRLADAVAEALVDGPLLLSWYDRERDLEAPGHVNECHAGCETPGYVDYAVNRGATLRVDVDGGRFVFCYRPLGEFAGAG